MADYFHNPDGRILYFAQEPAAYAPVDEREAAALYGPPRGGGTSWLWYLIGFVVAALILWWLLSQFAPGAAGTSKPTNKQKREALTKARDQRLTKALNTTRNAFKEKLAPEPARNTVIIDPNDAGAGAGAGTGACPSFQRRANGDQDIIVEQTTDSSNGDDADALLAKTTKLLPATAANQTQIPSSGLKKVPFSRQNIVKTTCVSQLA